MSSVPSVARGNPGSELPRDGVGLPRRGKGSAGHTVPEADDPMQQAT